MHETDHLARMRVAYSNTGLAEADLAADWLTQFQRWFDDAATSGMTEPNAMVVATASASGVVSARTVLAKGVDSSGVVFYTNYESAKSRDLRENPSVALTFPWYDLHRQVHVRGVAEQVSRAETAEYWALRPRGSQIGSSVSQQSTVVSGRAELDDSQAALEARFGGLDAAEPGALPIPVPDQWGGWRIRPLSVEFWQGRTNRLHDRLRFRRLDDLPGPADDGRWVVERLAP
ncbi:MAG: pyridoxamine 5'-phosphate oxidase [Nakamurella sp.]